MEETPQNITNIEPTPKTKLPGIYPNRGLLYASLVKYAPKAIKVLVKLLNSKQDTVKIAAAKELLSRTVPALSTVEVEGKSEQTITYKWLLYGNKDPILERMRLAPERGVQVLEGDVKPQLEQPTQEETKTDSNN